LFKFKMVKAADTCHRDLETDNIFKFKVLEHEHDTKCDEWNAESTLKLKDVVVTARQLFKWLSSGADATLKENPSQSGLHRGLSLSGHCNGKSEVMPTPASKSSMRANTARHVSECADVNTSASLKRACAGVETARRPYWYSEHRPNVDRVYILRKCLVRAMSPKTDRGGHTSESRGVENTHTFILHTFYPTRPASWCHALRFCPRTTSRRRLGVTTNSPTKSRVEVVQLNYCYTTINWKYAFLTGPERRFKSDSCI